MSLVQRILPSHRIWWCGDCVTFQLSNVPEGAVGYVRCNLGKVGIRRQELISQVEAGSAVLGGDWHDIPMCDKGNGVWERIIPLTQVGVFSVKCFCQLNDDILWAAGDDFFLKVEPPQTVGCNLIYAAFVRQFGANKYSIMRSPSAEAEAKKLDDSGYTVIPKSGTFRDLINELDFIFNRLGSDILLLLPIHPTPVQYARMGRFGSPFASTDYFNVDPALAEFDTKVTPLEQFGELVDAVHSYRCRIFLDIPVNHTGWNSRLQAEHPELFVHDEQGNFVSPGAWGVVWADLCKLDYSKSKTWEIMAEVFLFWCRRGVDGFRCDAGYMVPKVAWDYIVAKVRDEFPFTVFMLEGLGGPMATQEQLLSESGLNWAYSELFQNYSRGAIEHYYGALAGGSRANGVLMNFAETHDNSRLAAVSAAWSKMRCSLTAAMSDAGGFGITNGVEFLATEQIDVHGDSALNWNSQHNIVDFISRLQRILRESSCFHARSEWRFVHNSQNESLAIYRHNVVSGDDMLILLNLAEHNYNNVSWHSVPIVGNVVELLSGRELNISTSGQLLLAPAEALFLSSNPAMLKALEGPICRKNHVIAKQNSRWTALKMLKHLSPELLPEPPDSANNLSELLKSSATEFLAKITDTNLGNCINYEIEEAVKRQVIVFGDSILSMVHDHPFRATLWQANGFGEVKKVHCRITSMPNQEDKYFALLYMPKHDGDNLFQLELSIESYNGSKVERYHGHLLMSPCKKVVSVPMSFERRELLDGDRYALLVNELSGYSQVSAEWGIMKSKYDAILAANCNPNIPVDRYVMFSRCRAWLVFRDYSFELNSNSWVSWHLTCGNKACWEFSVPVGEGISINIRFQLIMADDGNGVKLKIERLSTNDEKSKFVDSQQAKIILRPDLEDRVNHTVTKAFAGAEHHYPKAIKVVKGGFDFAPADRTLSIRMAGSEFVSQPEWSYMVNLPREEYYGLESKTDLFSPGYLEVTLCGNQSCELNAYVNDRSTNITPNDMSWSALNSDYPTQLPLPEVLLHSLDSYVVKRDDLKTVIAGYPWFLDWGRDTLICLRGLMSAGKMTESSAIIRKFATFEKRGTIPNMINGNDVSNRDTSDAPLMLIIATADYIELAKSDAILQEMCGKRKLLDILKSIADFYMSGTPNGIGMDQESKLIFSPRHFTWMDTNFPAATPREGYPIDIQALWYASLNFLSQYFDEYKLLAKQVQDSVEKYYYLGENQGFSDCLHAHAIIPASRAKADNAVRPNQLWAITLGVVTKREQQLSCLHACSQLLIPGAIRSLGDRRIEPALPVYLNGYLLNNPDYPYQGYYVGAEDTCRKVAYHNGTAWCWPFPLYVESLLLVGGDGVRDMAMSYMNSAQILMTEGVPWHLPEVADGNFPHRWGGCGGQAWSVTEFYRIWHKLLNH